MSKVVGSSQVLRDIPSDTEGTSSAKWEDKTDLCLPKNDSSAENCNSPNPESETGQFELDVCIADRNCKRITTSEGHIAVAKESDGGWGWVIVLGGFAITMLLGGCTVSFSLLYLEFVDLFDATRAVVGWIGSLYMFMSNILGNNISCLLPVNLFLFYCNFVEMWTFLHDYVSLFVHYYMILQWGTFSC